ncbi:hypothetical protein [Pseudomonas sp. C2B4]|uniref:hypothetical protein n=1 Tax=Pseudomonas sp. C2B4 TaxID=2735270 RepID=UPI0015866BF9|nr:hypothetical protein [Pseudomonas sp. C2B4]NUU35161.1 hypothetical protein [Pseudomonas sp. C2B4]
MSKSITINVSSGTSAIGTISQGDSVQTSGNASISKESLVESEYSRVCQELLVIANNQKCNADDLAMVQACLQQLMKEALVKPEDTHKWGENLKVIRENFPWAYPVIKDFLTVAWPALLAAIVT